MLDEKYGPLFSETFFSHFHEPRVQLITANLRHDMHS